MVIFQDFKISQVIKDILRRIHTLGPNNAEDLETLAYIKKFNPTIFRQYEPSLLYILGLFYKTQEPQNLLEATYNMYAKEIQETTNHIFTPVQASAYHNIKNNRVFSFSAPTSIGKSYLFRELLKEYIGDVVIIVPSRALLAEYMHNIKEEFKNDKSILILQFIENINISNTSRRIYIITPERSGNLFKLKKSLNIELFLFDEAQDLEDEIRQVRFDALVRRINIEFPEAKIVFTQPFANNPDAQLKKHSLNQFGIAQNYKQLSIGKICVEEENRTFRYFSPYNKEKISNEQNSAPNIPVQLLQNGKTILIYVSKDKIYKGKHLEDFRDLIALCPPLNVSEGLHYVQLLQEYIGSSEQGTEKKSLMIQMMKRGIVIHHGSIPLKARLIIEEFVNKRFARICFATSTLLQGINMPFDAVWIDNFYNLKPLALKNLIGRAGRTTTDSNEFNFGYVIVKSRNKNTFSTRINDSYSIQATSALNSNFTTLNEDIQDTVEAIQTNTFNDEYQLTNKQVERLQISNTRTYIENVLNTLFNLDGQLITERDYHQLPIIKRNLIKEALKNLYSLHLRRRTLTPKEQAILSTAIPIILWRVQGKSFKEILALRYAYIARKDEQRVLKQQVDVGILTNDEVNLRIKNLNARFSPIAQTLPNKYASGTSLFRYTSVTNINYDLLVYDTYDYIDKVISLSIANALSAAFSIYFNETNDGRAQALINYIKYGTNDETEIWLLRYGFAFDDIEWIKPYIQEINENRIVFKEEIDTLSREKLAVLDRFNAR